MGDHSGGGSRGGGSGGGSGGVIVAGEKAAMAEMDKRKYDKLFSPEASYGLDWYLRDGFLDLNKQLRSDEGPDQKAKILIKQIDKSLEKLPSYRGTVYRTIDLPKEKIDTYANLLKPGVHKIVDDAYASASTNSFVGNKIGNLNYVIKAKGKSGKTILQRAPNPLEKEILFKRGTQFKITGKKRDVAGGLTLHLEEL